MYIYKQINKTNNDDIDYQHKSTRKMKNATLLKLNFGGAQQIWLQILKLTKKIIKIIVIIIRIIKIIIIIIIIIILIITIILIIITTIIMI